MSATIFKVLTTCRRTSCKIRAGFYQEKARGGPTPIWKPLKTLLHLVWCPVWSRGSSRQVQGRKHTQNTKEFFPKMLDIKNSLMIWIFNCMTTHFSETKIMETRCIFDPLCDNCRHERINDHYWSALAPKPHQWVSECIWLRTQMALKTVQKQMPLNRFMSIKTQFSTTKFVISLETKWGRPFSTGDPVCSCWGDICNRSDTIRYLWESVKAMALLTPNLYSAVIGPCDKPFPFYIKCGCSYPSLQTPQLQYYLLLGLVFMYVIEARMRR